MKLQRFFGGMLLCLGVIGVLIALIATVLPMIPNDQIRLILDSLQTRNRSVVANALNQAMFFILRYPLPLLGAGAGLILIGALTRRSAMDRYIQASEEFPAQGGRMPYAVLGGKEPQAPTESAPLRKPVYESILFPESLDASPADPPPAPSAPDPRRTASSFSVPFSKEPPLSPPAPPSSPTPHAPAPPGRERPRINPYHAYGQRSNSGPGVPPSFFHSQGTGPLVPVLKRYARPTYPPLAAEANTGAEGMGTPPGTPAALPYRRPRQPGRQETLPNPPSAPLEQPADTALKPSSVPLEALPFPVPEKEAPDPQYISKRIRSTMKRKTS